MNAHPRIRPILILFALALAGPVLPVATTFAANTKAASVAKETLQQDARVRFGTLPNGVSYAVLANNEPRGRASLRLLVKAGSLDENEDQRGLAHFLEHMAFNGSKRYAPGTLIEFFQRMGMSFGGDTNASTGYDRTQYQLEMAQSSPENLREGLQVLTDYAGGLLLLENEIDKERGIIASEKLSRDSIQSRTSQASTAFLLGKEGLVNRQPIGIDSVINAAPRERFLSFYDTWYRPENLVVVMVGDFNATEAETLVQQEFGILKARAPLAPRRPIPKPDTSPTLKTGVHAEAEDSAVTVSFCLISPYQERPDSVEKRRADIPARLAVSLLNRRLGKLAKKEESRILSAGASVGDAYKLVHELDIQVSAKPENWTQAVEVVDQELRKALEHGFLAEELKEVKANILTSLRRAVISAPTRRSAALADELLDCLFDTETFITPESELALYEPVIRQLTAEDCLAALRAEYAKGAPRLFMNGRLPMPEAEAPAALEAAFNKSKLTKVDAPASRIIPTWSYSQFGTPGTVSQRLDVEDLNITMVTFSNGVRLNIKKTPFEAGRIRMLARVGEGSRMQPITKPGLPELSSACFDQGGLGRLNIDDLQSALAGHSVGWRFGVGSTALQFSGATTSDDLLLQCQLLAAKLTDPGFRSEALQQVRRALPLTYEQLRHSPEGPLSMEISSLLASGDPRFGTPQESQVMALSMDDIKSWLVPQLDHGPVEIGVVGDVDTEACIKAFAATLGALPPRHSVDIPADRLRVEFPSTPFAKTLHFESEIPKSMTAVFWPGTDGIDVPRSRRMNLLAAILMDRLRVKIREEMGDTYSPMVGVNDGDGYPDYGYYACHIEVSPEHAERVRAAIIAEADALARNGVTKDELERARKPLLTSVRESSRTNNYWLERVISRAQSKPAVVEWARTRESDTSSITKEELDTLAARYLGADKASSALILSTGKKSS